MSANRDTRPVAGLLLGDPGGIGPSVAARVATGFQDTAVRLAVIGSPAVWERGCRQAGVPCLKLPVLESWNAGEPPSPAIWPAAEDLPLPPVAQESEAAGRYCLHTLREASSLALDGRLQGFAYAPMHKGSLQLGGSRHVDDMGLLSDLFGVAESASEINVLDELSTARVTSHVPLAEVPGLVSAPAVLAAIQRLDRVLDSLGVANRTLAVAGLNPHAGDGGLFGDEELETLEPAIAQAQADGISVVGPVSPDTVFVRARRGEFGGVVTMYHDQGQIAMKLLGFERGVTYASGLPVPVTTTAHGTAFDIAGTNKADAGSLTQALRLCIRRILADRG